MSRLALVCPDQSCGHLATSEDNFTRNGILSCVSCGCKFRRKYFGSTTIGNELAATIEKDNETVKQRTRRPFVRVNGVNFLLCKCISSLITENGIFHKCEQMKCKWAPLSFPIHPCSPGLRNIGFDHSVLLNYYFAINERDLDIEGYGVERYACDYVSDTLIAISEYNNRNQRLIPVYVPADGLCLLHSISRALCGREILWHPLGAAMHRHLRENLDKYKRKLTNFIPNDDWNRIKWESNPNLTEEYGGLRQVHIYILSNVLRRPIILFDAKEENTNYGAVFLPSLDEIQSFDPNVIGSPIVISWCDNEHNHFVPWVPLKSDQLPKVPIDILPPVFNEKGGLELYMDIANGYCIPYKGCMEFPNAESIVTEFRLLCTEIKHFDPQLLADFCEDVIDSNEFKKSCFQEYSTACLGYVNEQFLYRCTKCSYLSLHVSSDTLHFYDSQSEMLVHKLLLGKWLSISNGLKVCTDLKSKLNVTLFLSVMKMLKLKSEDDFWANAMSFGCQLFENDGTIYRFLCEHPIIKEKFARKRSLNNLHIRLQGLFPGQVFAYSERDDAYQLCLGHFGHHKMQPKLLDKLVNKGIMSMVQVEHYQGKIERARQTYKSIAMDHLILLANRCPR